MKATLARWLQAGVSESGARRAFLKVFGGAVASAGLSVDFAAAAAEDEPPAPRAAVQLGEGPAGGVVVQQLKAMGVRYIFHTNTTGLETVMDAVSGDPDLEVIMLTDEGLAVSAAEGYALASGELGFFVGSGAGVGNATSSIYNAWKDHTPLLVTFTRASLKGQGGQNGFEDWDAHLKPTEAFTAWNWSCVDAETMPDVIRRAVRRCYGGAGAPVTLDLPGELLRQKISAPVHSFDPKTLRPQNHADAASIAQAAGWLAAAKSPILVVGHEVTRGGAGRAVVDLAESLGLPVFQGDDLYSDFPSAHPLFLGGWLPPIRFPEDVDLVLVIGSEFSVPTPNRARLIHVSNDPETIGRIVTPDLGVAAPVQTVIADLQAAVNGLVPADRRARLRSERTARVQAFSAEVRAARQLALKARFDDSPLSWERVGYELERTLDPDCVVVHELGTQKDKLFSQMTFGVGGKERIGRTLGMALGWGAAAALGVQLARPDKNVVAMLGDGAFLFSQTEALWSVSRYDAPMLYIVMNNHSYNETRNRSMASGGPQDRTGHDMTSYLGRPEVDFSKIAAAYGIAGAKVADPKSLQRELKRAMATIKGGRPFLLDVEVAREGIFADSTWSPPFSIAALRGKGARA